MALVLALVESGAQRAPLQASFKRYAAEEATLCAARVTAGMPPRTPIIQQQWDELNGDVPMATDVHGLPLQADFVRALGEL